MLRRVALVRTEVSEKLSASFIRMTRIGELGTTLAVSSNRRTHASVLSAERAEWTLLQTNCYSENLAAPGIEPATSGSATRKSDRLATETVVQLQQRSKFQGFQSSSKLYRLLLVVAWLAQWIPTAINIGFLGRSRYVFIQVAP
jgi:hypothetical protein